LMIEVARDFFTARAPTDPDVITDQLGIPRRLLEQISSDLRAGGLLREVESGMGLVPGKDLEHLSLWDVLEHMRHGTSRELELHKDEAQQVIDEVLASIDHSRHDITAKLTLRALCERLGEHPVKPQDKPESIAEEPVH
jgi:DNA-binding IscR family transcriptional regulator